MGASLLKITRTIVNQGNVFVYEPSDILTQGVNSNGAIHFVDAIGELSAINLHLFDAPYESYTKAYGPYAFPAGQTTQLKSVITDVDDIAGMYLWTSMVNESIPIVAPYSACGAPTVCSLGKTLSSGENVSLSWSGATAGTANAVTGYEVQRAESTNGSTWGAWETCPNGVTSATSLAVSPPATYGNYYRYRVRTLGSAGASFYSAWKECANMLRRDHAPLAGFTDSPLVAGATLVKALHMAELQSRVNELRAFYGLSAYTFSPIDARGIAGWTDHVKEIRAALDAIGKSHEAWITIPANCPRADVIEQLRAVVLAT